MRCLHSRGCLSASAIAALLLVPIAALPPAAKVPSDTRLPRILRQTLLQPRFSCHQSHRVDPITLSRFVILALNVLPSVPTPQDPGFGAVLHDSNPDFRKCEVHGGSSALYPAIPILVLLQHRHKCSLLHGSTSGLIDGRPRHTHPCLQGRFHLASHACAA